ncbi:MAG: PilW family protein [Deltaproteobacteria bacterium]|jgi:prepilin-type N-terminal cleavage/methylation domain-containing protein|nr:PilW family protein [Deltaproteobacteria bacterium]
MSHLNSKNNLIQPRSQGFFQKGKGPLGLTLIELLVAMMISLIVTGVAFSIYRLNASYYLREDAYLQQYQNLRVALYTLGRDIRMAGNGLGLMGADIKLIQAFTPTREIPKSSTPPPTEIVASANWFRHSDSISSGQAGVRAIYGVDGGANSPDTLTVFRAEVETGNSLSTISGISGNMLMLDTPIPEDAIHSGDIIAVGEGSNGIIFETGDISFTGGNTTRLPIKPNGRFTAASPLSSSSLPFDLTGSFVYNFRDIVFVTYYVDTTNNYLMADYHDISRSNYDDATHKTSIVANNIEDLQLFYYLTTDTVDIKKAWPSSSYTPPSISSSVLNDKRVKAVSLGLVAKAPYGVGPTTNRRPALFNRTIGTSQDNFIRNTLVETIYLRNYVL